MSSRWSRSLSLLAFHLAGATTAHAQGASEATALDRYQDCFQKMIDAGTTDNAFMRRCLGLQEKAPRKASPTGELEQLSRGDALEVAEGGLPAVKECYANLLSATKDLGVTPEGTVEARLKVKPTGEVAEMKFEPGSLTDVSLLACLKEKLSGWKFPKTTATEAAGVAVSLRLSTTGKRLAVVTLAKGSPEVSGSGPGLTPEELLSVFRKNLPTMRQCYDEQLKREPGASGNVALDLLVNARGRVAKVGFRELTIGDEVFKSCVTTAIRKWKFPKPRGGELTPVRYPAFQFAPK